jgi:hypothetical protein
MTDLSIFHPVVSGAEFPTILCPLLDLKSLFTLVCVSKRVRELYLQRIASILREENAASRMMRACVRELKNRRGVDPRPAYTLWCSMNASPIPNGDRFLTFDPTTSFTFVARIPYRANPSVTCNFEVVISSLPTDRFIRVRLENYGHILFNMRVFKFGPNAEIPQFEAYQGERNDPHVLTEWEYEYGTILDLQGRRWVGEDFSVDNNHYRLFKFHKDPDGERHASILARDLLQSACLYAVHISRPPPFPRLELD